MIDLKRYIKDLKLTQKEFSDKISVNESQISRTINGKHELTNEIKSRIESMAIVWMMEPPVLFVMAISYFVSNSKSITGQTLC